MIRVDRAVDGSARLSRLDTLVRVSGVLAQCLKEENSE